MRLTGHAPLPHDRPLRILIGPKEIGGQIPDYAAGFRALGHQVTTVIREPNPLFPDLPYDVDLSRQQDGATLLQLVEQHDVFVFQFGESLVPGSADLSAIRNAGKSIIAICNGDDIRHSSAYHQEFGIPPEVHGEFYVRDPLSRPMRTLRNMERFASLMVSVPNQSGLALRPYMHFAYVIDPTLYTERIPDREVPVVVHAPSDRACKGTAEILASLDRLKARGIAFDLTLLERVPNAVVRETLRDADVAIDQLFVSYGKFAAEAMASGCATACVTYPDIEPFAALRPLHHIDAEGIDAQLEQLLTDRALRRSLAARGRAHIDTYHDRTAVCRRLLDALGAGIDGSLRYDYYPAFYAERYALPPRTELPRAQRLLSSEVIEAHGVVAGTDLEMLTRRGLIDAWYKGGASPVRTWLASDGLLGAAHDVSALRQRWETIRTARPVEAANAAAKEVAVVSPPLRDPLIDRFMHQTSLLGADAPRDGSSSAIERGTAELLRMGTPALAIPQLLPIAGQNPHARRAAALLLLGSGQFADARDLLATFADADSDGVLTYYQAVAQALAGDPATAAITMRRAIERLPRQARVDYFGSTPILSNRYWAMALRAGGTEARTLMGEYYGKINRRSDYDVYFDDVVPMWTAAPLQPVLAPYHAFLFLLLTARALHTSFDGGPLGWTAMADAESALLKAAGVRTVVIGYGGDCTVYANVRDLSHRHAFLASYPQAARDEPRIRARLDRWNADADCIVTTLHSLDGHGRWDVLSPSPFQIDTTQWAPIETYNAHDGRTGSVRVIHTPNHRGYKGTEFVIEAVRRLREEGLAVELDLLEGVQNSEVRTRMRQADILAEQFICPMYALSGIEGMATGLAVMANTADPGNQVFRRYSFLEECPVLGTSVENLVPHLRRLVTDPALRRTLGMAGRQYVEKYHSFEAGRALFGAIHASLDSRPDAPRLIDLYHPLLGLMKDVPRVVHPLVGSLLPADRAG
jgi:glycosyltransferase involved in cell wall biosynthesis